MRLLRLTRKLEGLNDDALAHFEAQADLLLTLPACCRAGVYRHPLHLVDHPPDPPPHTLVAASLVASSSAARMADRRRRAEERAWLMRSRRLAARVQASAATPKPAKVPTPRRRLALVRRARSG